MNLKHKLEGMKTKVGRGLASLAVAASLGCGPKISYFYGPNGEEIAVEGGNCDDYEGRYLWNLGDSDTGTIDKISDCQVHLESDVHPEFLIRGIISGNKLTVYEYVGDDTVQLPFSIYLLKKGEFTPADLSVDDINNSELRTKIINEFMCYFDNDKDLRAMRYKGLIKPNKEEYIWKIEDRSFAGYAATRREWDSNPRYTECRTD